jgi:ABC-2 type transport system permease protein
MLTADRIWSLTRHNLTLVAREPGPMISRIAMPVVIVLVLRPLYSSALGGRGPGTTQAVVGMLVMFSLLGMSVVGTAVLTERIWHTLDRLRATPARPAELLAGKAVPVLLLVLAQQAVILGLGVTVLGLRVTNAALLALTVLVWAVTLLCCGTAIATVVRSQAELSAVVDIGGMLCTVLAGALVPLSAMPGWARHLSPVSPGYWAMRALRGALAGQVDTAMSSAGVLAAVAGLAAIISGVRLARGWGRDHVR